jgi:uncharacterized protein (DUF362 family)
MTADLECNACDFEFTETMWGYVSEGAATYEQGYEEGEKQGNRLEYEVTIHVEDFNEFKISRKTRMTGWMMCGHLFGKKVVLDKGEFGLYWEDPVTGEKRMSYEFHFTTEEGSAYRFFGYKVIVNDPGVDILEDHTTLYATIYKSGDGTSTPYARGIIHYHLQNLPQMIFSFRCPKKDTWPNRIRLAKDFLGFVAKDLKKEYLQDLDPLYKAEYRNLVFRGKCDSGGEQREFFFFSGKHPKGFPWGDPVGFDDVALILKEGETWRRFALTDQTIAKVEVGLSEKEESGGDYHFEGSLFEIKQGYQVSFREMHQDPVPGHLRKTDATIDLRFKTKRIAVKTTPFEMSWDERKTLRRKMEKEGLYELWKHIRTWLQGMKNLPSLGYTAAIHRLTEVEGHFVVDGISYSIKRDKTLGEGERGTIISLRKPSLYYNYFCAIEPEADSFRVQVRSGILRSLSKESLIPWIEDGMGAIVGQIARMDFHVKGEAGGDMDSNDAESLILPKGDLLEINNDQYRHKTFQRRIVTLPGASGAEDALGLEEDMSVINLEASGSDETAHVVVIKSPDRFEALDQVLLEAGFFQLLDETWRASAMAKEDFSILIKPNFSFMYSLTDLSTFTDPHLVEYLVHQIRQKGYTNVSVVEAQSTYSVFFTNRDVPTLAKYIGLAGNDYNIIDLSEAGPRDPRGLEDSGIRTHLEEEVHPAWRNADFRISFAKNKTHAYAFYSLTMKNIYGALPRKNKFKEYHCNRKEFGEYPIYTPTIDFLEKYPVHFGLIDAYFSADGAFGVFADKEPNYTSTIIGGDNLVAVDWVAASKMGLDPMISTYMDLAIRKFGKPSIKLTGDHSLYPHWRNVPPLVTKFATSLIDRDYITGGQFYAMFSTMDPFFTFRVNDPELDIPGLTLLRALSKPLRKMFFEWVRGTKEEFGLKDLLQWFKGAGKNLKGKGQLQILERITTFLRESREERRI